MCGAKREIKLFALIVVETKQNSHFHNPISSLGSLEKPHCTIEQQLTDRTAAGHHHPAFLASTNTPNL